MRGVAAVALAFLLAAAAPLGAQETPRVVRQLRFDGNSALSSEVLASAIATTNSSWFARVIPFRWLGLGEKRYFDEQEFKRDVVRLQVLYRRSGYPHAEMDTVVKREPTNVYITLKIREGEPIRVTSLTVTGLDTLPGKLRRETLVDLPIQTGDPFNRFIMQATADTITRRLKDRGRPAARVFTSFETNRDAETATLAYDVVPGKGMAIGTVNVIGVNRIEPLVVRNLLITRPGRTYSQDELYQSQRNLYSSDLFRYATVNIDSAAFDPAVPIFLDRGHAVTVLDTFSRGTTELAQCCRIRRIQPRPRRCTRRARPGRARATRRCHNSTGCTGWRSVVQGRPNSSPNHQPGRRGRLDQAGEQSTNGGLPDHQFRLRSRRSWEILYQVDAAAACLVVWRDEGRG